MFKEIVLLRHSKTVLSVWFIVSRYAYEEPFTLVVQNLVCSEPQYKLHPGQLKLGRNQRH